MMKRSTSRSAATRKRQNMPPMPPLIDASSIHLSCAPRASSCATTAFGTVRSR
jgi:hypothetical protein